MSRSLKDWVSRCLMTGFFVGYSPIAPGTVGTLVGLLIFLAVRQWVWVHAALTLALFFIGVVLGTRSEKVFQQKDPHAFVLDEVVGFLVTTLGVANIPVWAIAAAFLINRGLDIVKPFPINRLERFPGGWGIMLDDLGAGLGANLALRVMLKF